MKFNCDDNFNQDYAAIEVIERKSDGYTGDGSGCCVNATSSLLFAIHETCWIISQLLNLIIESDCKIAIDLLTSERTPP